MKHAVGYILRNHVKQRITARAWLAPAHLNALGISYKREALNLDSEKSTQFYLKIRIIN